MKNCFFLTKKRIFLENKKKEKRNTQSKTATMKNLISRTFEVDSERFCFEFVLGGNVEVKRSKQRK
jgi:hypothetical protein